MARDPGREAIPAVQKMRIRHAKRGRLRFTSHRDFQRAFERGLRRANIPMAYSAGFSPHPKISYANAAPTGVASEAEYVEISVVQHCDPVLVRDALVAMMPPGLDIVDVVTAHGGDLVAQLEASVWQIELPMVEPARAQVAADAFLASDRVEVERMAKSGLRRFDAREAVLSLVLETQNALQTQDEPEVPGPCAILTVVVRHGTPTVRPDDVLAALCKVADLELPVAPRITRLSQGPLLDDGRSVGDPFATDRSH